MRRLVCIIWFFSLTGSWGFCQLPGLSFDFFEREHVGSKFPLFTLCEDSRGRIWFGTTGGGVGIFDGYSTTYLSSITNQDSSLISNFILTIYRDHEDRMWVGTYHGFSIFDSDGNWLRNEMPKADHQKDFANYCESFLVKDGVAWIGTHRGLFKYHWKSRVLEEFHCPRPPKLSKDVNDDFYIRIAQNKFDADEIYLGSNNGLKAFNTTSHQFRRIENENILAAQLRSGYKYSTFDLKVSASGKLSIAAFPSSGYLIYDPESTSWQQFLVGQGSNNEIASDYNIYSIQPVTDSLMFYGTNSKFGYVDLKSGKLKELTSFKGGKTGYIREMISSEAGIIWMACENGLIRTKESLLTTRFSGRKPEISKVEFNGKVGEIKDEIVVDHRVYGLNIDMVLVNPVNPKKVSYRWRLKGLDQDWRGGINHNRARYTNLKGGVYTFEFQTKHESDEWIDGESFSFKVEKQISEYFFFYPTLVLAGGAMIALVFGFINHNRRKATELKLSYERQVVEAELNALRSQMNPHFTFNSLNTIYNYIHNNQSEYAAKYLAKFSKLMRMALQNSREKLVVLEDEIEMMKLYLELEQIRFENKFSWSFHLDLKHPASKIQIPPMLVQPYITNAIWHGIMHKKASGAVTISFTESERLEVCIRDNGIGRKKSRLINKNREKRPFGMEIAKKRIELFEIIYEENANVKIEDLSDKSGNLSGTLVRIDLPLLINDKNLIS